MKRGPLMWAVLALAAIEVVAVVVAIAVRGPSRAKPPVEPGLPAPTSIAPDTVAWVSLVPAVGGAGSDTAGFEWWIDTGRILRGRTLMPQHRVPGYATWVQYEVALGADGRPEQLTAMMHGMMELRRDPFITWRVKRQRDSIRTEQVEHAWAGEPERVTVSSAPLGKFEVVTPPLSPFAFYPVLARYLRTAPPLDSIRIAMVGMPAGTPKQTGPITRITADTFRFAGADFGVDARGRMTSTEVTNVTGMRWVRVPFALVPPERHELEVEGEE